MPVILVNFLPPLSKITGTKEDVMQVENDDTVQTLLEKLCLKYGEKFRVEVFHSDKRVRDDVCLLVNGIKISELDEAFGQRLDIFLMLKGG